MKKTSHEIAAIEKVEAARMCISTYIQEDIDLTILGEALDLLDAALEVLTEGY